MSWVAKEEEAVFEKSVLCTCREQESNKRGERNIVLGQLDLKQLYGCHLSLAVFILEHFLRNNVRQHQNRGISTLKGASKYCSYHQIFFVHLKAIQHLIFVIVFVPLNTFLEILTGQKQRFRRTVSPKYLTVRKYSNVWRSSSVMIYYSNTLSK